MKAARLTVVSLAIFSSLLGAKAAVAEEQSVAPPKAVKSPAFKDRLDRKPITMAKVTVTNSKRVSFQDEQGWTYIPPWLKNAEVILRAKKPDPSLEMTVQADGDAIVAASFISDGQLDEKSKEQLFTYADFIDDGWGHLHYITRGNNEHYMLFHKRLKKGDSIRFRTRAVGPPFVLIPDEKGRQHIAHITAKDAIHESTNLKFPQREQFGTKDHSSLLLNTHRTRSGSIYIDRSILSRELVRQAILLASREELHVKTRDAVLRERFPRNDAPAKLPVEFVSTVVPGHNMHVTLFHRIDGRNVDFWENYFELPGEKSHAVEALTAKVEQLSRTEFITALKAGGFSGQGNEKNIETVVPSDIEELLEQMSFIPQFSAIRQTHQLIRDEGESPLLLGALARGYANLGVLTSWNYSCAHQVFCARSLLYAERMVASAPLSPESYWARAYARTLLGRHHTALEDLQKATELADDADAAVAAPAWVELLKAVCLYDESQLDAAVAHPKHGYLARLLRIVAGAGGSRHRTVQEAAQLLKSFPDSDFALVSMYQNSNYSIKRQLAELASRALVANMYDRILAIPELPPEVKKLAATLKAEAEAESDVTEDQDDDREVLLSPERQGRLKLIEALHEAGSVENDSGELSWGCLGQLILEATFMQAVLQASNQQWSGDDDQLLEQLLPTIGDHPYRNYLLTTSQDPNRVFLAREQVFDELWIGEVELHVRNVFDQFYYSGNQAAYHRYLYAAQVHAGDVFPDLIAGLNSEDKYQRQMWIRRMQRVAPHQPLTIAKSIHYDWPFVEDRWEELENRYLQAEDVQLALGHKLTELNSYQAAERCLKRRMALLPNGDAYNGLAKYYKKTKQIEKWLATMDEFLKSDEAFGNMGAGARIEVAEYYMQKKQWEKARPYAYQAAEQGSQRKALYCAIKCAEGLGDYEAAETFMRAVSERHSEYQLEWYCWCKKNNFGDLAAARELAVNYLDSIESPTQAQWMYSFGIFYLLEGELDEAIIAIENAFEGKSDPYMGLHLAIIADELEEPEIRDKTILQVLEHGKDQPSSDVVGLEMVQIAKVFQSLYASNGQKKLNLEKVNEIFKSAKEWEKNRIDYFVGRVLLKYGESGDAEKYLLRSAQSEQPTFTQLLAASLLHERGIDYRDETASEVK